MESLYSTFCLIRRVTRTSPVLKVTMNQRIKYACRTIPTRKMLKVSKIWNAQSAFFYSLLYPTAGSHFFIYFSNANNSIEIRQNSRWFLVWYFGIKISRYMKKRESKNLVGLCLSGKNFSPPIVTGYLKVNCSTFLIITPGVFRQIWNYFKACLLEGGGEAKVQNLFRLFLSWDLRYFST